MADAIIEEPHHILKRDNLPLAFLATKNDPLMSLSDILQTAEPAEPKIGIYILIRGYEIVYVGRTQNAFARVAAHQKSQIKFDRWKFIPCEYNEQQRLEARYISAFNPPWNFSKPIIGDVLPRMTVEHALNYLARKSPKRKRTARQ